MHRRWCCCGSTPYAWCNTWVMAMTAKDRRRLWGKSGNRCALCRQLLTRPEAGGSPEAVLGEEAHIIGAKPGSARHRRLPERERDAYENRVLLCPTDHKLIDAQPEHWTVKALHALKDTHEETMTARTADTRPDGLQFDMPGAVVLAPVITGTQLLAVVGPAYAYHFDDEPLEDDAERVAAKYLLGSAHDWGEIYATLNPAERMDAAESLGDALSAAHEASLVLYGALIDVDVHFSGTRDRWPVGIVRLRRMEAVAKEQAVAREMAATV
jgi:hypothetical protein